VGSEFTLADADVANAIYQTEVEEAFDPSDAFHSGLWRTTREVLEAIDPPWFAWPVNADGTDIAGCPCGYFAAKIRAAGFTVAQAGFVRPRPAWKPIRSNSHPILIDRLLLLQVLDSRLLREHLSPPLAIEAMWIVGMPSRSRMFGKRGSCGIPRLPGLAVGFFEPANETRHVHQ